MEPTRGNFDMESVDGFDVLNSKIVEAYESDDPVSHIAELLMNGHEGVSGYLVFGNNKISKNTGIFNMNSATDCPNADSTEDNPSEVGICQVPWESCYAHKAENIYNNSLKKRRLQQHLWDSVDAMTLGKAILRVKERKRSAFDYLRLSESGDFRDRADIIKADRIAQVLEGHIDVYTYSASHKLDWTYAKHFTVNQSNNFADYGDRQFSAVPDASDVPEEAIFCPFEAAKENGIPTDERPKCGECTACIKSGDEQERDVYITIH